MSRGKSPNAGTALAMALVLALAIPLWSPPSALAADALLLVGAYRTKPSSAVIGQPFDLTITLSNARGKKAENVVVTVGTGTAPAAAGDAGGAAGGGSLVVLGTGNTKYVGTIGSSAKADVSFRMVADPSSAPGVRSLPVTIEYTASKRPVRLDQVVGVLLARPARMEVTSFDFPAEVTAGKEFTIGAEVMNVGEAKVGGVALEVRAEGGAAHLKDGRVVSGTLEVGDADSVEAVVTVPKAGTQRFVLAVSWVDEFGRAQETTRPAEIVVKDADKRPAEEETKAESGGFLGFLKAFFGLGG